MSSYVRWKDIRSGHVERAGGEQAVEAGKQELLASVPALRRVRRS
ncbi:hypothetical protein GCM10027605_17550 [Micromonospora zhanjiangensis]